MGITMRRLSKLVLEYIESFVLINFMKYSNNLPFNQFPEKPNKKS